VTLHVLLLSFLAAVHPMAPKTADAPTIVSAIERVVSEESEPVFGTRQADAVVLAYTAWAESRMHLRAVGDHGKAFGAFQVHSSAGRADAVTQARAALGHLRRDRAVCPSMPVSAFVSGNCAHGRRLARYRMKEIMRALRKARLA